MIKVDFHDEPELNHNKIDYQSTFENFLGKLRCSPSFSVCEQNIDTSFESDNSLEVEFVPEEPAFWKLCKIEIQNFENWKKT